MMTEGKLKSFHLAFLNGGAGGTTLNTREGGSESKDSTPMYYIKDHRCGFHGRKTEFKEMGASC